MAALEIHGTVETSNQVTDDVVSKTIDSLENPLQKVNKFCSLMQIS